MLKYFEDLEVGLASRIKEHPDRPNARKKFALEIARIGKKLYSGQNRVAWCGISAPFDLLTAMDVTSCFVEFVGAMLATTGFVGHFLEKAEQDGYAADTCGYHRSVIGATREGVMPVPEILIATSCPCSGGLAVMENLARYFKKDLFVLNVPQEESREGIRYLADQIKDMVDFVVQHTGQPLDKERLAECIENTNFAREIMVDVYHLAQNVPSPTDGRDLSNLGIVHPLLFGSKTAIEIAQAYREEFTNKIAGGNDGMPDERLRLMWIQNRIQFKNPLEKLLKEEYGANIVVDELNDITWEPIDPDDPYSGLARRIISIPINGEVRGRVAHLKAQATAYKIDGAINPCHWGCRQGTGARGLIADGLKEIGVPVLNLEVDAVDIRNFSEGQLRTRIEAFVEMLESRPALWK